MMENIVNRQMPSWERGIKFIFSIIFQWSGWKNNVLCHFCWDCFWKIILWLTIDIRICMKTLKMDSEFSVTVCRLSQEQLKKKQLNLKRITDVKLGLRPKPDRSCTSLRFSAGLRWLSLHLRPLLSCWDAFILQPFSLLWPLMSNTLQLKRRLKPLLALLLCWTPQQTSGLFCCPISRPILGGTKENRRLSVQKVTLHHVVHSQPDTETMRRRWMEQRRKGAGLVRGGGGGTWNRGNTPSRELCVSTSPSQAPEAPAGPDCGGVGWNNSCLINQRVNTKESRTASIWSRDNDSV